MDRRTLVLGISTAAAVGAHAQDEKKKPLVVLETSMGEIHIELNPQKAPVSVKNFLDYVAAKHYDGTVFHRVVPDFVIQGGGFTAELMQKPNRDPIKNEAGNGLLNTRGTLAMARTSVVDSATAQLYINLKDNDFLNHRDDTAQGFGYCVFGRVVKGMDVVDRIAAVKTGDQGPHRNVPLTPVTVKTARLK